MNNTYIIFPTNDKSQLIQQALITIDTDINAERVVIADRRNMVVIHNKSIGDHIVNLIVPLKYLVQNNLLVGILDDDMAFNCQFIDGVTPELINGNTVTLV
jgi:hypothetical protein